jgi:hypothetical protein
MSCPEPALPSPSRVSRVGWWSSRELSYLEAEAHFLRLAAKAVGKPLQAKILFQAECNRAWRTAPSERPRSPLFD